MKTEYHMRCGCSLPREQLVKNKYGLMCPNHKGGYVDHIMKTCELCGKEMNLKPRQNHKKYCSNCTDIAAKVYYRERYEKSCDEKRRMTQPVAFDLVRYTRGWEYYLNNAA